MVFSIDSGTYIYTHIQACSYINKHTCTCTQKPESSLDYTVARLLFHYSVNLPHAGELSPAPALKYTVWDVNHITQSHKIYMIIPIKEVMGSRADVG